MNHRHGRMGLAAALMLALSVGAAQAQESTFSFSVTPAGVTVSGSITVDGQTYTADEIRALAEAFVADSTAILMLPPAVSEAVVALGSELRARSAGGAP